MFWPQVKQYILASLILILLLSSKYFLIKIEKPITVNVHKVYNCSVTVHQHKTEDYAAATTDCCVTMDWRWHQGPGFSGHSKVNENPEFLRYGNIVVYLPNKQQLVDSSEVQKYFYTMISCDVTHSEAFVIQKWQIEIDKIRSREWTKLD